VPNSYLGDSFIPALRQAGFFPAYGRQVSSVPIPKENKVTDEIADVHNFFIEI
jgi:hypothetical protein